MQAPKPPSRRLQRDSELIKRELSELIRRELSVEKIGLLSVNEVKVAPDLKNALVFVGHLGTPSQRVQASATLETHAKRLNLQLGAVLRLKWTPILQFRLDDSVTEANRVLAILEDLEKDPATRTSKPSGTAGN
jgi:ribosome-binding factor A